MFSELNSAFAQSSGEQLREEARVAQTTQPTQSEQELQTNPVTGGEQQPNPEVQQIPHNGDRLIMVINFILREVLTIQSREAKLKLLNYYLGAILSESLLSPFTSLAYSIQKNKEGKLTLHDDIYQARPDLLAVVEVAAASVIDEAEQRRYNLEKEQVVRVIAEIETLIMSGTSAHLILHAVESSLKNANSFTYQERPQPTDWLPAKGLISQEVALKMDLPSPDVEAYAHKKLVYTMPQSEVHRGNMSVLVIAQPIYIPKLHRVILLHDQCFFPADWKTHCKVWRKLGTTIPSHIIDIAQKQERTSQETHEIEEFFMTQLCLLPHSQLLVARKVFEQLLPEQKLFLAFKEWQKQRAIKRMNSSLQEYSKLVLTLMEKENKTGTLSPQQVNKISLFLKRIVLAGILTREKISAMKASELLQFYYEHGHQTEETFARTAMTRLSFAAAGKTIDLSLLECVSVGTINGFGMKDALLKMQLNPQAFGRTDIAKVIGAERAKKWKNHQNCIGCHRKDVWVGECGLCLPCELHQNTIAVPAVPAKIEPPIQPEKPPLMKAAANQTIAVGNLVASLI